VPATLPNWSVSRSKSGSRRRATPSPAAWNDRKERHLFRSGFHEVNFIDATGSASHVTTYLHPNTIAQDHVGKGTLANTRNCLTNRSVLGKHLRIDRCQQYINERC
jgi:hypothetical protein